jgi:hypothetical protein
LRSTVVLFVLTFAVLGLLLGYAASYPAKGKQNESKMLQFTTDKTDYGKGDIVTFTAKNLGSEKLLFPDSALGISIKNIDNGKIYGIIAAQVLTSIEAGQSKQITWQDAKNADVGNYIATIHTAGGSSPIAAAEVKFKINT